MISPFLNFIQKSNLTYLVKLFLLILFELSYTTIKKLFRKRRIVFKKIKNKKLVVLTGGSKGIGENILKILVESNFEVIVLSRTKPKLPVEHIHTDLSDFGSIKSAVKQIGDRKINIIINNAGVFYMSKEKDSEDMNLLVNYFGHYFLITSLLENFNKDTLIIFTSSSFSFLAKNFITKESTFFNKGYNYCASKVCINLLVRIIKRNYKLKCVAVHPGLILTNIINSKIINRVFNILNKFLWFVFDSKEQAAANVVLSINNNNLSNKPGKCDFIWKNKIINLNSFYNEENEEELENYTKEFLKNKKIKI